MEMKKVKTITEDELGKQLADNQEYKYGFTTDIESEVIPVGLDEDVVRLISSKKDEPQWLLDFRLKAFANWKTMTEKKWAHVDYPEIDFQSISYYAAPKEKVDVDWDDVDPELKATMDKLGISMDEQKSLSGVAVDFVIDSVSVKTSLKEKLGELGIIFC